MVTLYLQHFKRTHIAVADSQQKKSSKSMLWLKRLGFAGFLFFLLKGLAWLAVIWLGIDVLGGC
ncbi:MAG TPA: hypothetical protein VE978_06160 [Chitinophagales bacterium]|nr:hypothetical protein [Chitinophagales bacterium]